MAQNNDNAEFQKVVRVSNWGYWDSLDGHTELPQGDYRIQWPDGAVTIETVFIETGTYRYMDMGHEVTGKNNKAYVTVLWHGVEARLYVNSLRIAPAKSSDTH